MAFVSMIFVFLVIAIIILAVMAIFGAILLIIGLIKKKKYKGQGKKFPYVLITLGVIFLGIPIGLVGMIAVNGVMSSIKTTMERKEYNNFVDKWKNEWVSDSEAESELMEELLLAAENKDKEAIKAMFSEKIQLNTDLERQIDEFLQEYPEGFSDLELEKKSGSSGNHTRDEYEVETFHSSYEINKEGTYYYISVNACYQADEGHAEDVGLESFILKSEKAETLDKEYDETDFILADMEKDAEFE